MKTDDQPVLKPRTHLIVGLVAIAVALNGILLIAGTLLSQHSILRHGRLHIRFSDDAIVGTPLILGLTLLYLSFRLLRRKQLAWYIAVAVYSLVILLSLLSFVHDTPYHTLGVRLMRNIILSLIILGGLLLSRRKFTVKSDIKSFRQSLVLIVVVLGVTFIYGVAGFMLMNKRDFHHEIGFWEAAHRTIDQLGLTTNRALVPYTRRARVFVDSLSVISIGALVYTAIALFQPLKARFRDQSHYRAQVSHLLTTHEATSEDFFKLWPHDKVYYLNGQQTAALALRVQRSVALVVGDPVGKPHDFGKLVEQFLDLCDGSDWLPAFIHTEPKYNNFYEQYGFSLQKIGQEAVLNLEYFQQAVAPNKYFRQIRNKFSKNGYSTVVLEPPHSSAVISRLSEISHDWLSLPGRDERGFMMGYFTPAYMQQCKVMVARDSEGVIQAFINQLPAFNKHEANYDLLQHVSSGPTNLNDFLLLEFINYVQAQGFTHLNLGLCPLAGLDKNDETNDNDSVIDSALRFVYANGDRFYSFSGLERFKSKYEPEWSDRFIAYRGGIAGFTRTINALNRAMKVKHLR